ncbi:MAG: hypothetical protein K6F56_05800 [Oscillospiraceae bacterium]|nr:hypothetical protein [Oscillospiraceae bacterium]
MKRLTIVLLLCVALLLTGCGKSRAESELESFSARLNTLESLRFTARVRAEYEHKTARFTLGYEEDAEGGRVTVLAPELIRGVSARFKPGGTTLEYDSVVLDTGSLDSFGLTPMSSLPVLLHALRVGHAESFREEDGQTVVQLAPDDTLLCTVWFEKNPMRPVRAELVTDGRVTVVIEISEWGPTPAM